MLSADASKSVTSMSVPYPIHSRGNVTAAVTTTRVRSAISPRRRAGSTASWSPVSVGAACGEVAGEVIGSPS
jgi:hypothetical protein